MSDVVFLKGMVILLGFAVCCLIYAADRLWITLKEVSEKQQCAFDYLQGENTEREIDIRMVCEHIGIDYDEDIKDESDWYLSDIREG